MNNRDANKKHTYKPLAAPSLLLMVHWGDLLLSPKLSKYLRALLHDSVACFPQWQALPDVSKTQYGLRRKRQTASQVEQFERAAKQYLLVLWSLNFFRLLDWVLEIESVRIPRKRQRNAAQIRRKCAPAKFQKIWLFGVQHGVAYVCNSSVQNLKGMPK